MSTWTNIDQILVLTALGEVTMLWSSWGTILIILSENMFIDMKKRWVKLCSFGIH
jgi:hypothetical protein